MHLHAQEYSITYKQKQPQCSQYFLETKNQPESSSFVPDQSPIPRAHRNSEGHFAPCKKPDKAQTCTVPLKASEFWDSQKTEMVTVWNEVT